MKTLLPLLLLTCGVACTATAAQDAARGRLAPAPTAASPVAIDEAELNERVTPEVKAVRRAENSVVSIYVLTKNQRLAQMRGSRLEGQGSGVIVDASGFVITNWHVVAAVAANPDAHQVQVRLKNNQDHAARLVNVSQENDLALLKLELKDGDKVQPVAIADSDKLMVGETVIAIGNPQGHANTVTRGVLSATDREITARTPDGRVLQLRGLLQTDAAINQGNSGGALLDITGKLIGINNAMAANAENIGFAIPVNTMQRVFKDLLVGSASFATWLGVTVDERDGGLVVNAVEPGGPAAEAGLREGDRLTRVGDEPVASALDYARALVGARAGRALPLLVRRGNRDVEVKPVPRSRAAATIARLIGAQFEEVTEDRTLLRTASTAFSERFGRSVRLGNVLRATAVSEGSPAESVGLAPGDVLVYWVNRDFFREVPRPFDNEESLAELLGMARGRELRIAVLRNGEVLEGPLSVR